MAKSLTLKIHFLAALLALALAAVALPSVANTYQFRISSVGLKSPYKPNVLTGFSIPALVVGSAPLVLAPPSSSQGSMGAFSYVSSSPAVASISGSTLTALGIGSTTITVSQAAAGGILAGSTTALVTVSNPTFPALSNAAIGCGVITTPVTFAGSGAGTCVAYTNFGLTAGKLYFEAIGTGSNPTIGVAKSGTSLTAVLGSADALAWGWFAGNAYTTNNGYHTISSPAFAAGDVAGIALDLDNHMMYLYKNGVLASPSLSIGTGTIFPAGSIYGGSIVFNFGEKPFNFAVPSGYQAGFYR